MGALPVLLPLARMVPQGTLIRPKGLKMFILIDVLGGVGGEIDPTKGLGERRVRMQTLLSNADLSYNTFSQMKQAVTSLKAV